MRVAHTLWLTETRCQAERTTVRVGVIRWPKAFDRGRNARLDQAADDHALHRARRELDRGHPSRRPEASLNHLRRWEFN